MWACGPQAVKSSSVSQSKVRSRIWMAILLKGWPSTKSPYATQTAQRRVLCNWRAHAQATSECVQPRSSPFSNQQRPQRISPQLSLVLRIHRARSPSDSATALHARDPALQELRPIGTLRRRSGIEPQSVAQNLPSSAAAGWILRHTGRISGEAKRILRDR